MNEQIKLIKEDINFIEKYYGTDNFNGLINDMLLHLKAVENQLQAYKDKENKLKEHINKELNKPFTSICDYEQGAIDNFCKDILQILNDKEVK